MSGSNENSASDSEEMRLVSNPVLKIFLEGLYDENCNLSKLRVICQNLEVVPTLL